MSIMLREISQQPAALDRTLRRETRKMLRVAEHLIKRDIDLVILVARGTSDNAALFARYLIEITTGIPVSLSAPSVHTMYRQDFKLRNALVIGISQSGEGKDVNVVLERCKKNGAHVLAITNEKNSRIANVAHETFQTHAGPEKSVAATKTYTCQLMLLYMLAHALKKRSFEPLYRIPDYAEASLRMTPQIDSLVERYRFMEHCVVVGRGLNYSTAHELTIKLMETCYVIADCFSSADFWHGPIAIVQRHLPMILFAPPGKVFPDLLKLARKLQELKADTTIVSSEQTILRHASCGLSIPIQIPDLYSPIPYIIPGQILAARLSVLKGLSPDRPRGLHKITKTL